MIEYKNILVMDGDLQHHPKYISNMLKVFSGKNCDIVIGSRDFQKKVGLSFFRKTFSKILIVIINTFLGNKNVIYTSRDLSPNKIADLFLKK